MGRLIRAGLPSGIIDPGGAMKGVSAAEGMKNNVAAGASSPGAESIGAGADAGAKSANPQASFNEQAAKAEEGGKQIFSNAFQRMKDDFFWRVSCKGRGWKG